MLNLLVNCGKYIMNKNEIFEEIKKENELALMSALNNDLDDTIEHLKNQHSLFEKLSKGNPLKKWEENNA